MTDRSSIREVALVLSDHTLLLDSGTLLFQHFGPRALLLGDMPSTSSVSPSHDHIRSMELPRPRPSRVSSSGGSQGSSYGSNPGTRRFAAVQESRLGRTGRRQERTGAAAKYNFTPEERRIYESFIRLLANFEADDMFDIISDVLKDAKSHSAA